MIIITLIYEIHRSYSVQVALVTWTAIVTTSSESNVANFSDEKVNF